nr:PREDICTED: uncharacterized protein LOC107078571 [Lepisosteus oculatus]
MSVLCSSLLAMMCLMLTNGTPLKKDVLEEVIHNFMSELEAEREQKLVLREEFSFLLALSGTECLGDMPPMYIATFYCSFGRKKLFHPIIGKNPSHFYEPSNLVALFPVKRGRCAEASLLRNDIPNWFASQHEVKFNRLHGEGCLIFFTRRSPCLKSSTLDLLNDPPFSDEWTKEKGIHKYFVFTAEFPNSGSCLDKKGEHHHGKGSFVQEHLSAFLIRNCKRMSNTTSYTCQDED